MKWRILFFILFFLMNVKAEVATFAGGCFWCMQHDFDVVDGVTSTTAGYTGGKKVDPTYEEVSAGKTGHVEAVQVTFDPEKISYQKLLDVYWHNIDPTRNDGQFCDDGSQYRPVIFYSDDTQKKLAQESRQEIPIKPNRVEILPAQTFYPAEEYHQEYWEKNPIRYKFYRYHCGRDARLKELWSNQ